MADFTLPELGENITEGAVLRVLVKPGDALARDQTVLELETDKATIEVPSSVAGRVTAVSVKPGDTVKVGQVVLSVEDGGRAAPPPAAPSAEPSAAGANTTAKGPDASEPDAGVPAGRARPPAAAASNVVDISRGARGGAEPARAPAAPDMPPAPPAPAAPSVRRMARELGVEIGAVSGSGPDGRISAEDVKAHVKQLVERATHGGPGQAAAPLPDFSRWGEIERQPMRGVRKKTAEHLSVAWSTIPHVTQHDLADITALEDLRKKYAKDAEAAGGNLTVTAIAVKVVAAALKSFPQFNASIDMAAGEIVYKKYVNVGVAVDTERGLLVPVVREADSKNIIQIAVEIAALSAKARAGKLALQEMQGGCFSISNLGGIGGRYFTPIVNAPELAVLGISRARMEPVYQDDQFVARLMLPLSLSYDHRAIDGADGIRFLRWVIQALEQPFLLALQG